MKWELLNKLLAFPQTKNSREIWLLGRVITIHGSDSEPYRDFWSSEEQGGQANPSHRGEK